jgi:hypothetical protein
MDSEAMSALGGHASKRRENVRAAIRIAAARQHDVVVPAVILAVAAAVEAGGGVVLTGDEDDLTILAAPYANINVQPLP